jgi:steroid delta-isomerase-like uncharacterized protein
MTREDVVQLFEAWDRLWAKRDPAALTDMYAPDCTVSSPIFGDIKGRAAVEESNRRLFKSFPDWDLKTEQLIIDGNLAVQVMKVSATHAGEFMGLPGSGRKAQFQGVRILRIENNLIQNERRLYDFTMFLMQVGVLRGKPAH